MITTQKSLVTTANQRCATLDTPALLPHRTIVTLINRQTEDEETIVVFTATDSFSDVIRAIAHQKVMLGLKGYEIWETLSEPGF